MEEADQELSERTRERIRKSVGKECFCVLSLIAEIRHKTMPTAKHSVPACGFPFGCVIVALLFMAFNSPTAAETKRQPAKPEVKKPAPKKTTPTTKPSSEKTAPAGSGPSASSETGPNAAIAPEELVEFQAQPEGVKKLIETCLTLARQNLTYTYNSSDPANGGLDCSGFIYHVLRQHGYLNVPRDSSGQYTWVRRARGFRSVLSQKPDSFEFDELLPGDLLFWVGTYSTDHDPPISHVMLYLGAERSTGARVMIGASDGRTYRGTKRKGVSVFDFLLPRKARANEQSAMFVGYGRIPGLRN